MKMQDEKKADNIDNTYYRYITTKTIDQISKKGIFPRKKSF